MKPKKTDSTQFMTSKHEEMLKLVKTKENKVIITAGQYRVSKKEFDTFNEADQYVGTKPYELIFNVTTLLIHMNNETKKDNSKDTKDN